MKKYFISVILMMSVTVHGIAQDIPVYTLQNLGYYQDKTWPEGCEDTAGTWWVAVSSDFTSPVYMTISQLFTTDREITIYGLAGIFLNFPPYDSVIEASHFTSFTDSCLDNTFDTMYIHNYDTSGTMRILKSVRCGYNDSVMGHLYFPYSHYNDYFYLLYNNGHYVMHMYEIWGSVNYDYTTSGIYDVREAYFDSVINISDSFYVAAQNHNVIHSVNRVIVPNRSFMMMMFSTSCMPSTDFVQNETSSSNNQYMIGTLYNDMPFMLGIFPILTPPAVDTTGHGGDTTAVDGVDGVGRYVSLSPNPAEDKVQVLSSFGLNQVEAYNAEGRLVYADEAHGLSKTIDLTAWPRGIYLVRIITPMGTTTKKLVLQ